MTRKTKRRLNNKAKVLITVVIVAICLFVLHKFDFFTKSDETNITTVNFVDLKSGTNIEYDLEYFQDENNNSYIVLPETINGYYTSSFQITAENPIALFNNSLLEETDNLDSQNTVSNEINDTNSQESISEPNSSTTNNENSNTNTIKNETPVVEKNNTDNQTENVVKTETTNTVSNIVNTNTINNLENTKNEITNTIVDNQSNKISDISTMSLEKNNETNTINPEEQIATMSLESEEDESKDSNTITNNTNNVVENTVVESTNTVSVENTVVENTISTESTPKTEADNLKTDVIENVENISTENHLTSTFANNGIMTAEIEDATFRPGEKIYLDAETIANGNATIDVTLDTKDVNGVTLYNRIINSTKEVSSSDVVTESYILDIKGYIPKDYYLNMTVLDNNLVANKISGVEEFEEASILLGLDITITDGTNTYNPKDYQEFVIATLTSETHLKDKITNSSVQILHFEETETEEKIEKIVATEKTENSVKFVTDSFSEYAVIAYPAILPDSVTIDDYTSDYNYYMGKNYTDNASGTYNETYSDANLAKVNINYYSYDPNKNPKGNNDLEITNPTWAYRSMAADGTYNNYTVRLTINAPTGKTIDPEKSWYMELTSPNAAFSSTQTRTENQSVLSSVAVDTENNVSTITMTGNDLSGWTETTKGKTYTVDLVFAFSNNTTVNMNNVTNLKVTVNEKILVGYVSADENERQMLFSYIKCLPIDGSGNVTVELIDNPYMDRPAGYGFNGWTSHQADVNFTINNDTKLQKATVNTNGAKEVTIDLYVNWSEAFVVFVNAASGNNSRNGLTPETAVKDWATATGKFTNSTRKTITNASNREVNIIVITGGTVSGFTNLQPGLTITSLYDGVDYRSTTTMWNPNGNVSTNNYDLQLDFLNITGSNNYTSTTTTDDISRTLYGYGRNVRIGRGMTPINAADARTTFAQIQGGPRSNVSRSYRLVIESGKYANMHLGSVDQYTYTSSGTMVFGCDYDRIKNENSNLRLYNRAASRSGAGTITSKDAGEPVHKIIIKSGTLGVEAFNNRDDSYEFSGVYIGGHSSGTDKSDRIMIVEGGNVANLLGGLAIQTSDTRPRTFIYMKGGHVQYIVGGAGVSTTRGQRTIQVTGGSVAYSVAGGSNGVTAGTSSSSNPTGQLDADSLVYVGGNAVIGTELGSVIYDVEAGCVLGAGNGNDVLPETAGKVNNSHVIIDGEAIITNSVYGGGNFGIVGNNGAGYINTPELIPESVQYINHSANFSTTEHYMIGNSLSEGEFLSYNGTTFEPGTYNTGSAPTGADDWILEPAANGRYYLKSYSENKYVTLTPNYIRERVQTGRNSYVDNAITGLDYFSVTLNAVPTSTFTVTNNGGGVRIYYTHSYTRYYRRGWYSYYTTQNVTETNYVDPEEADGFTTDATNVYLLKFQDIENDGNETEVTEKADATTVVNIDIYGGTIQQNVYGGANKNNILGSVDIYMEDGTVEGAIYGGSNDSGTVDGAAIINVKGGTLGKQTTSTDVLFGGGRGDATRITQRTLLNITDEKNNLNIYGSIYGGSALGRVSASSTLNINDILTNTNKILINGNIFGGGRGDDTVAALTGGKITVNVDGGTYSSTSVFGGCNERGIVLNSILVNIGQNYATRVANVYGGGNNAAIIGSTNSDYVYLYKNATVEKAFNGGNNAGIIQNNAITPRAIYAIGAKVGELYGGSNNSGDLTQSFVYVSEGATITNLYGGGFGENAKITGKTTVDIKNSTVEDCVYGGGNAGSVGADTDVDITGSSIGNVYAGGKGQTADVTTNTVADISNSTINGNVYGGGNDGAVGGYTDVNIQTTNVGGSVYAAGQGRDAEVTGYTTLDLTDSYVANNVYGGGNNGAVKQYTDVNIINSEMKNVYAGGEGATAIVTGNSDANITGSTVNESVYGGGNAGQVVGNTVINTDTTTVGNSVYGGGKAADVNTTSVTVKDSQVGTNIYGGGEEGKVLAAIDNKSTTVNVEGSRAKNVFGGGKGSEALVNGSTSIEISSSNINKDTDKQGNVFGGGDKGSVNGSTSITISDNTTVADTVYGGGNEADVNGSTSVAVDLSTVSGNIFGGGNAGAVYGTGAVGASSAVSVLGTNVGKSVFGGGNQGEVTGNTNVLVSALDVDGTITNSNVSESVYGGGNEANVNGTTVAVTNGTTAKNVYGGGNLGEVTQDTDVLIDNATIGNNVYGGGAGSTTQADGTKGQVAGNVILNVRNSSQINNNAFGGGQGVTAIVKGNIEFRFFEGSSVKNDLYGGGDNGQVNGTTSVYITSSSVGGSAYAAGNGANAKVLQNSYILAEGSTTIGKSIFGGGNASETGTLTQTTDADGNLVEKGNALTIVDIAGAVVGENVYGGANSSVINGSTVTNIGVNAIDEYYGEEKGFEIGKIEINGTVFGGGENMDLTSDDFNYDAISVTETILINIDGKGYETSATDPNTINIYKSIFGSGNASSARQNGDINIRNYGTIDKPKRGVSVQRATNVLIDKSSLLLSGTTDRNNEFVTEYFSFNRIASLKIKNNTTLYMLYGANLLSKFESMVGEDGAEVYAEVDIIDTVVGSDGNTYEVRNGYIYDAFDNVKYYVKSGAIYEPTKNAGDEDEKIADIVENRRATSATSKNVDNRIYMYSGRNFNISNSEYVTSEFGDVKGMTFFGIFKSSQAEDSGENPGGDGTEGNQESTVHTGMYAADYTVGNSIDWDDRDFTRSYVLGLHQKNPEQDITKDGFYTVYEQLTFELEDDQVLTEEIYDATSYMSYIDPTPEEDAYYMWYAGPDEEIFYYTINLVATKHSTLGTKELSLHGISYENATLEMTSFDAALIEGVGLYDKNTIPNINTDPVAANNNYGLTMKTGNTGWSMIGSTDFTADALTEDNNLVNSQYFGTTKYTIENLKTTPLFNFYFYHSNNIKEKRDLGTCQINMKLSYWKDALNRGNAKVIIDVVLSSDITDEVGYNGAITPGSQYDLFTTSVTNVTTKSSFSTYFELAQEDFMEIENIEKYYEDSYRVFTTEYAFPEGTTITMIDRWNKNNPEYYYYTVTAGDYSAKKVEYRFSDFKTMGSSNEKYEEKEVRENYYITENGINYQYENFIFIVNFENANFTDIVEGQSLITKDQHFRIYLKADDQETGRTEILFGLLDAQIDAMVYGIYDTESTIEIEADLNKRRAFLGSELLLDVDTIYNVKKGEQSVIIYDTRYFDKKLGIKITFFVKNEDGDYEVVNGADLLGTYFELNGERYYPRADGTTRIKIAELVSNASSTIKIVTENSSISTGEYQIKVESFGSADGIYYGIEASDSTVVNVEIINDLFGLNSTLPEKQTIIDKTTGYTLDDEGFTSKDGANKLEFKVEYLSGLNNPYITVSLYRRNYDENIDNPYDNTYTKVDLADYVSDTLEAPVEINQDYTADDEEFIQSIKQFDKEYKALDEATIKGAVSDETISVTLNKNYTLKDNLVSGTYKVVYTLYDVSEEIAYKQETDKNGNITEKPFNVNEYAYIGDTFSYIIIK